MIVSIVYMIVVKGFISVIYVVKMYKVMFLFDVLGW